MQHKVFYDSVSSCETISSDSRLVSTIFQFLMMTVFSLILIVVQLLVLVLAKPNIQYPHEWHSWKAEHGIAYKDDHEELGRHIVWLSNQKYIDEHNKYSDHFGFSLKMNKFGDMTNREFESLMMCVGDYSHPNHTERLLADKLFRGRVKEYTLQQGVSLPETVDWRTAGAVTFVKDQLRCGCSYAFSAVGAIEGANALAKDNLVSLSAQNIVDCSVPYGNHGCTCGDVNKAFMYVINNNGINTEKAYPYISGQYYCRFNPSAVGAVVTGIVTIGSGDEEALEQAVATAGPISVYVDASQSSFQFYYSGVLNVPNCSRSKLTHAMVVIGYGVSSGSKYWLVKNSWGPNWGQSGLAMMSRGKSNQCGIATYASFPTL